MTRLTPIKTIPSALTGMLIVSLIPLAMLSGMPLYAPLMILFVQTLAPLALCLLLTNAGLLPAVLSACSCTFAVYTAMGAQAALLCAGYLLLTFGTFTVCYARGVHFWKTVLCTVLAHVLAQTAALLVLQLGAGFAMDEAAAQWFTKAVDAMPERDAVLISLYRVGYIKLPDDMLDNAVILQNGVRVLAPEVVSEMLKGLDTLASGLVRTWAQLSPVTISLYCGVFAPTLALYFGARTQQRRVFRNQSKGEAIDLSMPPLSQWFLPRGWGLRVGLLAPGYLLALFASSDAVYIAGQILWNAFTTVYAIQGLAVLDHLLKARSARPLTRKILMLALFVLLRGVLVVLGVMDQVLNLRKLRPPLAPTKDTPNKEE